LAFFSFYFTRLGLMQIPPGGFQRMNSTEPEASTRTRPLSSTAAWTTSPVSLFAYSRFVYLAPKES